MNCHLMYRDKDFALSKNPVPNAAELMQDLELNTLTKAMAAGDSLLLEVAQSALLQSLQDTADIVYRQEILIDCMAEPTRVREIHALCIEALEREKRIWGWLSSKNPEGVLHHSVEVLQLFLDPLNRLRIWAEQSQERFTSEGFRGLTTLLRAELQPELLDKIRTHLNRLTFRHGLVVSAGLGIGNRVVGFVVHEPPDSKGGWLQRLRAWLDELLGSGRETYVYEIDDRDESGFRELAELKGRALRSIANVLSRTTDHLRSFFSSLRLECAFYLGCLNLREAIERRGRSLCFPKAADRTEQTFIAEGLYDLSLLLNSDDDIVDNDVDAPSKGLVVITGANRGGKSTLLRSIGVAQLMMQSGMFVCAESLRANVCGQVLTHFKREEDAKLRRGKFDEELFRMSSLIDWMKPGDMVLLNESLASTNETEGTEIARGILAALMDARVKVFYVTHMIDLVQALYREKQEVALFLRAERLSDGRRTFRVKPGAPKATSYAADLYERIFETPPVAKTP